MSFHWPPPRPAAATARATLERATATVGIASGLVATGRIIDLAGLDALAGTLCAQVLDLPPALGAGFRPALAELDAKIAALGDAMRQRVAEPAR